jgi:hypothetical protein
MNLCGICSEVHGTDPGLVWSFGIRDVEVSSSVRIDLLLNYKNHCCVQLITLAR